MRRSMLSTLWHADGCSGYTCTVPPPPHVCVCGLRYVFSIERRGYLTNLHRAIRLSLHRVSRVRTLCSVLYRSEKTELN